MKKHIHNTEQMYNKHTLPCNILICWTSFEFYNDGTQMHQKRMLLLQSCILQNLNKWMKRGMGRGLSFHASDSPMHWKLNWKSIENNNFFKKYLKGFNWYFNTQLWVSEHCSSGAPAGLNTDQRNTILCLPSACYYFFNKTFIPYAAKQSLLNKHNTRKGKPILLIIFKAKSTNNCFSVSALICMCCKYCVAILLNKTKVENFLICVSFQLQQWWHDQIIFLHPFLCL